MGKISAQTIEPSIYPIDWTHNPICLKEKEVAAIGEPTQLAEKAADSVDVNEVATKLKSALEVTEPENTGGGTQKVFHTKFIDGKSMETGGSSFDLLVADAPYDYVVLTDCVFAKELAVPLVNTILCCCGPRTAVICCHEIRDEVHIHFHILVIVLFHIQMHLHLLLFCPYRAVHRTPMLLLSKR